MVKTKGIKSALMKAVASTGIYVAQASSYSSMFIWQEQPKIPASLIKGANKQK